MSEEISKIARVYQFLTDYGEQWKDAADQCGYADGIITKAEFRTFMLDNFSWDGTDSESSKKDLINKFWATIDTKRSGRIAGSTKSNLDALDKNEVDKMQEKIEMYDMAIKYADSLSLPEGATVNDYSAWRKKIKESILSRVETYIKNGGKLENLQEFLETQGQEAVVITTADMIAQDLIKEKVGDIPGYIGYDRRNGDKALTDLIDNYVNSLKQNPNVSGAEISETITRLVNAYVSTLDGMPSESDIELLKQYGYPITEKSGLNDLQKAVLSNSLTEKLAKIKVGDDYDKYPELFDKAIEEFIKSLLEGTKMSEFATVKDYGIPEFEASEAFKNLKTKLQVSKFFSSDTFKNKIKEVLGETISERAGGKWNGELPALDDIITVALKNAEKGAFGNPIDENKLAEWAIKQIEEKIKDFFPNGFKDLSLTQMGDAYSGVEKSAQDTQNIETLRFGATSYCDALIARNNSAFKNAIIDLFGENYAEKIKTLSSTEISRLMAELIAKIDELGDATTFKIGDNDDVWGILRNNTSFTAVTGKDTLIGSLGRSCKIGERTIDSSRITYASSNESILSISPNSGEITIKGGNNTTGEFSIQVKILIDGVVVGTKSVNIKIVNEMKLEESDDVFEGQKIKDIMSGQAKSAIMLSSFKTWDEAKAEAKSNIQYYVNNLVKIFGNSSAKFNADILQKAAQTTINYFTAAIDAIYDHGTDSKYEGYQNLTFNYTDANGKTQTENTKYCQVTYKYESSAGGPEKAENISAQSCGISLNESYNNTNTYEYYLNTAILLTKFQEFYNSLL